MTRTTRPGSCVRCGPPHGPRIIPSRIHPHFHLLQMRQTCRLRWLVPVAVLMCAAPGVEGQDGSGTVRAVASRATSPIVVDGRLDEAAWSSAASIGDFVQREPFEGRPPSERTEVRIVWDDEA